MELADFMSRDHCRIEKLLSLFRESIGTGEERKNFDILRWELEKHMFIEERAIFTFARPEDSKDYEAVPELKREHDNIVELLNEMQKDLAGGKDADISDKAGELCSVIMKHKDFEDREVYPKLDAELDDKQKKIIVERITEFAPK